MSNRERWTVYPLLFLTLGISLRDKITDSVTLRAVHCEDLVVAGPDGSPRVHVAGGGPATSGAIVLYGQSNNPLLSLGSDDGKSGAVKLYDANGKIQVIVKSVGDSGAIETLNSSGEPQIVLRSNNAGGVITALRRGKTAATLGAQEEPDASALTLCAGDGKPRVVIHSVKEGGSLETLNAAGLVQVILNSTDRGGIVSAVDNDHNLIIAMGHEAQGSGLFAINLKENKTFAAPMLPQTLRQKRPEPPGLQPESDSPAEQPKQAEKPQATDLPKQEDTSDGDGSKKPE